MAYDLNNLSRAYTSVGNERVRQDMKWGVQDHDDFTWLAVLTEEVGESAQCALHDNFGGHHSGELRAEVVQVAAVAIAWIEALDRRGYSHA